ncbi:MAG: hypothetical protein E5X89_29895 [Mesorhizobium sp.]|nr:MAG: hypothetical protein E5X89_29895 [Mesorhizobium sp.]
MSNFRPQPLLFEESQPNGRFKTAPDDHAVAKPSCARLGCAIEQDCYASPVPTLVFRKGKVVEEFSALEATEEKVMYAAIN